MSRTIAAATAAAFLFCLAATDTSGQGTRRKRKPAPTPTPVVVVPRSGDAQVISRASDYRDDTIQLVPTEQKRPELPTYETAAETSKALDDIRNRINSLETMKKGDPDEKQKRLLLNLDILPEAIDREVAFAGTLRPEDLRAMKKKQLEIEKASLTSILSEVQKTRTILEQNLQRSDEMVEKLRSKLDKEVDAALADDPSKPF